MDQAKDLLEMPREFLKDGRQFVTRCSKPDQREFLRISQAVGMGFLIMGVIGYVVKLSYASLARAAARARTGVGAALAAALAAAGCGFGG